MIYVENILFDFNGTLVDDRLLCLNLLNNMLLKRNHEQIDLNRYLEIFTFPVINYYVKAGFVFPEDNFAELSEYFIEQYTKRNVDCKLYDGVKEILKYFKNKNKRLAIVSASEINVLKDQLVKYNINDYFFDISGLDNIEAGSKIESAKKFIEKHHLNTDKTVFIGDTIHDYEVAEQLNVKCILICKGHQNKKVLSSCDCMIIDDILQLKNILE